MRDGRSGQATCLTYGKKNHVQKNKNIAMQCFRKNTEVQGWGIRFVFGKFLRARSKAGRQWILMAVRGCQ
jgi:hypothetical protein